MHFKVKLYFIIFLSVQCLNTPEAFARPRAVKIAALDFPIVGTRAAADWEAINPKKRYPWPNFFYRFMKDDLVKVKLNVKAGKAVYDLEVRDYESGKVVFTKERFRRFSDIVFTAPTNGVYEFIVKSRSKEPTTARLIVKRKPANAGDKTFNTKVDWHFVYDSVYTFKEEPVLARMDFKPVSVTDTVLQLAKQGNLKGNDQTILHFSLPQNAYHWVYWLNPGNQNENSDAMLTAFGQGKISGLPLSNTSSLVEFIFMGQEDTTSFLQNGSPIAFNFAGEGTASQAYGRIPESYIPKTESTLYLGLRNISNLEDLRVTVKVLALLPDPQFVIQPVKKLSHINQKWVPMPEKVIAVGETE